MWGVLSVAVSVSIVVNQIEQPFARSLVVCDVPVANATDALASGSRWCGDRLTVIGEGTRLSGLAQSQESAAKCLMIVFIGIFADIYGRRAALLGGLVAVTFSAYLFVVASLVPSWAPALFVIAQALQGLSGGHMLIAVITGDLAQREGADSHATFILRDQLLGAVTLLSLLLGGGLQALELVDYTAVWALTALAATVATAVAAALFPETGLGPRAKASGLGAQLAAELGAYREMLAERPISKWIMLEGASFGPVVGMMGIIGPMAMAYHGFTQAQLTLFMICFGVVNVAFAPTLARMILVRLGYRHGFMIGFWASIADLCVISLAALFADWLAPFGFMFLLFVFAGMQPLVNAGRLKLIGADMNVKYNALDQLMLFFVESFSTFGYAHLFDAKAETAWRRSRPSFVCIAFLLLNRAIFFFRVKPRFLDVLQEVEAEAQASPEEQKKVD